jgi:exonuclease III
MVSIRIATLNINGMATPTRITMLDALFRPNDKYILLVQEATYYVLNDFQGYTTKYNIGANRRGTAIVVRLGVNLENIIMSLSGRAVAAKFRDLDN